MKYEKVVLHAYYNLGGDYIWFPDNPLHGKEFCDVNVTIKEIYDMSDDSLLYDVIEIDGCEPIDCELVGTCNLNDGTLIIKICQDWG